MTLLVRDNTERFRFRSFGGKTPEPESLRKEVEDLYEFLMRDRERLLASVNGVLSDVQDSIGGGVTSVGLEAPAEFDVENSPVTDEGTLRLVKKKQTANFVYAGPTSGGSTSPVFRRLVIPDIPDLSSLYARRGSIGASNLTMSTNRLLGRTSANTGAIEELTAGTSLSLAAGSLNTIQGIRTTDTPTFGGLTLQGTGDRDLFVTSTEPVTGRSFRIRAGSDGVFSVTDATAGTQRLAISASGDVGIGAAPASGTRLLVEGPGGATANLIIRGDGEQTYRLYNTAAAGTTRVSWKMANRLDPDWTWIWYTDSADNGTDDLTLQNRSGIVARVNAAGRMTLHQGLQVNGSIFLGTDANQIVNAATGNLQLYSGMIFDGVNNVARATTASRLALVNGTVELATNSGLTVGSPFAPTTRMVIDTSGNVGIGTTSPGAKLDVVGSIQSSSTIAGASIKAGSGASNGYPIDIVGNGGASGCALAFVDSSNSGKEWRIDQSSGALRIIESGVAERMRIDTSGNVGIGTASPSVRLHLVTSASQWALWDALNANGGYMTFFTNSVPIGDIGSGFQTVSGGAGDFGISSRAGALLLGTGGAMRATVSSAGALRLHAYGAGTLTTDSSGNVTATSDERAKDTIAPFTTGLAAIRKLVPKAFRWKAETGLNTDDLNVGLYAQDLIAAGLAEAVATERTVEVYDEVEVEDVERTERLVPNEDPRLPPIRVVDEKPVTRVERRVRLDAKGNPVTERVPAPYTVNDRTVIAALVNAVKELDQTINQIKNDLARSN